MYQFLLLLSLPLWFVNQVSAQKIWETKTATVRFIAKDDHDIDALNKEAVSRLEPNGKLSFIMLMKGFHFEMGKMEEHFNTEYMESDKFPRAFFNGQITNFNTVDFKKDGKYPITVNGTMQVHGVNKAIQTGGFIEIKNGIIKASAQFTVTLKDFGIGGIMIKMVADKIDIDVNATYPQ
jgi:hypothetical protein